MTFDPHLVRATYANSLYTFARRAFAILNPGDDFVGGYYLRGLCRMLERVAAGEVTRLIITLPPRHLKSQVVSVALPAWLLGRNPSEKVVCASYSSNLAEDFGRQTRDLMRTPFYRATFPKTLIDPTKSAVDEFHTLAKGRRIATSVGGTLTGKGGRILICDDVMKADDAESLVKRNNCHTWFRNTAASRLNSPKTGTIIIVAQRLHVDDLVGRLLPSGDWEHLDLPAIATGTQVLSLGDNAEWTRLPGDLLHPERITMEDLDRLRRELGSSAFEAQYQQCPVLPGGNLVKREWFGTYQGPPQPGKYEAVVQSWDTASVPGIDNDYSVCTTWGLINDRIDLLDVHRAQHHYADLLRVARTLRTKWTPKLIVVEKAGVGIALGNDLLRDGLRDVQCLDPKGDKVQRMALQCGKIEGGKVRLPVVAPWLDLLLVELGEFPNGRYDDQVDSVSQLLKALDRRPTQIRGISRYKQ
ncbi:phage terminase large subunit [Defluviimonas aestuarii]|uniref:phage terminase large subunit n=1 Tax=Albidovulum aestuarii TaxID=1130726 RepID=UPI00249ADB4B|nr:phage terminase large subunit [Defluviimonas aestuarii]MDI3338876.1 phage terminase large subunit [Defluviimonas aestuarii]